MKKQRVIIFITYLDMTIFEVPISLSSDMWSWLCRRKRDCGDAAWLQLVLTGFDIEGNHMPEGKWKEVLEHSGDAFVVVWEKG